MRNYTKETTYESHQLILDTAIEMGLEIEQFEGVLNDTYIIYNENLDLKLRGIKARKYIILYPQFLNAWSNTFHILLTDNIKELEKFNNPLTQNNK